MGRIVRWGLLAVVGYVVYQAMPDIARYLRMRRM
jgi:hypothetical protein